MTEETPHSATVDSADQQESRREFLYFATGTVAAGRIRKGPAPKNLYLPPHEFLDNAMVRIG